MERCINVCFFLAGFAVTIAIKHTRTKQTLTLFSLLALFLIFLGICSRHNAITGAVPLLFYFSRTICLRILKKTSHTWTAVLLLTAMLTGVFFFTKTQLDHYSLPNLVKLRSSTSSFIQSVRVLDIAGASICTDSNLFSEIAPNLSLTEIKNLYEPRHINLSSGLLTKIDNYKKIDKIWINTAIKHPICFFYHKARLTQHLIGAHQGAPFLITAPAIINNEYGYTLSKSSYRNFWVNYIIEKSSLIFFKPWFIYLITIGFAIYILTIKALTIEASMLLLSAVFYFASLVLFGNAADARLPFYTTTNFLLLIYIWFVELIRFRFS